MTSFPDQFPEEVLWSFFFQVSVKVFEELLYFLNDGNLSSFNCAFACKNIYYKSLQAKLSILQFVFFSFMLEVFEKFIYFLSGFNLSYFNCAFACKIIYY